MPAIDLCRLEDVKEFEQKNEENDLDDDALTSTFITRASTAIIHWTEREFAPVTAEASREFVYDGSGYLTLAPYDLRSITSLKTGIQGTEPKTLILNTDFFLRPKPSVFGTYTFIKGLPISTAGETEVEITGAWGFPTIPLDVVEAAVLCVSLWKSEHVYRISADLEAAGISPGAPVALPGAVKALLSHYRGARLA